MRHFTNEQVAAAVLEVLERPSAGTTVHLHRLADAYTMYAFLQQTPDVQKVVLRMFSASDWSIGAPKALIILATSASHPEAFRNGEFMIT